MDVDYNNFLKSRVRKKSVQKKSVQNSGVTKCTNPEFSGRSGSKLLNFGLMLNCLGLVRSAENIIGSVQGRGHKILLFFSVRSRSGQKITGQYGVGVPKKLTHRTLPGITINKKLYGQVPQST